MKTMRFLSSLLLVVALLAGAPVLAEDESANPQATGEVQSTEQDCLASVDPALSAVSLPDATSQAAAPKQGLTCEEECQDWYEYCMSGCWVGDWECREDCRSDYHACVNSC